MTLRDRLRRWWSPAQWEDDHPTERKQRQRPAHRLQGWFGENRAADDLVDLGPSGHTDYERDFKKPR